MTFIYIFDEFVFVRTSNCLTSVLNGKGLVKIKTIKTRSKNKANLAHKIKFLIAIVSDYYSVFLTKRQTPIIANKLIFQITSNKNEKLKWHF